MARASLIPMLQTKSVGLASAMRLLAVDLRIVARAAFWPNLAKLPLKTISDLIASHCLASKLSTSRPIALMSLGFFVCMIFFSVTPSLNRRALAAIMNCSADEYSTPSMVNLHGYHWLKQA